jgi:ASTRA-associated protein 1
MATLTDGRGINPVGIIMSMHLYEAQHQNMSGRAQLRLLCGYENGSVALWGYQGRDMMVKSVEGVGWEMLWSAKVHVESGELICIKSRGNTEKQCLGSNGYGCVQG